MRTHCPAQLGRATGFVIPVASATSPSRNCASCKPATYSLKSHEFLGPTCRITTRAPSSLRTTSLSQTRGTAVIAMASSSQDSTVAVTLKIPYRVKFGEHIGIVGGGELLGAWDPKRAVAMQWTDNDVWVAELSAKPGLKMEYKYIVRNNYGDATQWKPGGNYQLDVPKRPGSKVHVFETWDESARRVDTEEPESSKSEAAASTPAVSSDPLNDHAEKAMQDLRDALSQHEEIMAKYQAEVGAMSVICDMLATEVGKLASSGRDMSNIGPALNEVLIAQQKDAAAAVGQEPVDLVAMSDILVRLAGSIRRTASILMAGGDSDAGYSNGRAAIPPLRGNEGDVDGSRALELSQYLETLISNVRPLISQAEELERNAEAWSRQLGVKIPKSVGELGSIMRGLMDCTEPVVKNLTAALTKRFSDSRPPVINRAEVAKHTSANPYASSSSFAFRSGVTSGGRDGAQQSSAPQEAGGRGARIFRNGYRGSSSGGSTDVAERHSAPAPAVSSGLESWYSSSSGSSKSSSSSSLNGSASSSEPAAVTASDRGSRTFRQQRSSSAGSSGYSSDNGHSNGYRSQDSGSYNNQGYSSSWNTNNGSSNGHVNGLKDSTYNGYENGSSNNGSSWHRKPAPEPSSSSNNSSRWGSSSNNGSEPRKFRLNRGSDDGYVPIEQRSRASVAVSEPAAPASRPVPAAAPSKPAPAAPGSVGTNRISVVASDTHGSRDAGAIGILNLDLLRGAGGSRQPQCIQLIAVRKGTAWQPVSTPRTVTPQDFLKEAGMASHVDWRNVVRVYDKKDGSTGALVSTLLK